MNVPHPPSFLCTLTGGHIWDWDKDAWVRVNARAIMLSEPGKPLGPGLVDVAEGPCIICGRPWSAEAKTQSTPTGPVPLTAVFSMAVSLGVVWEELTFDIDWTFRIALGVMAVLNVAIAAYNVRLRRRHRRDARRRAADG